MTMLEKQIATATKELDKQTKTVEKAQAKLAKCTKKAEAAGVAVSFEEWCQIRGTVTGEQNAAHFDYFSAQEDLKDAEYRLGRLTAKLEKLEAEQASKEATVKGLLEEYSIPAIDLFLDNWEKAVTEYYQSEGKYDERMAAIIKEDKQLKKLSLIYKVKNRIGKVVDGRGLYVANDGNINGRVVGDKGSAVVQTILAGGYNIQCLHYRVLVK